MATVASPHQTITVRHARAEDVPLIFENIGYWASQGKMLVRPMQDIFENLRDFFVAEIATEDGLRFAGNGAVHVLWGDIAEVRGLCVSPDIVSKGVSAENLSKRARPRPDGCTFPICLPGLTQWNFLRSAALPLLISPKIYTLESGRNVCAAPFLWAATKMEC